GAINSILPLLNEAVNGAVKLLNSVKIAYDFANSVYQFAKEFAAPTDFGQEGLNQLNGQLEKFQALKDKLASGAKLNPIELFQVARFQQSPDQDVAAILDSIIARINAAKQAAIDAKKPITELTVAKNPAVNPGPKASEDRDVFDRTIDQITKHTAQTNADTVAIFQNNAVRAQLRAEFELLNAVLRDHGEVTQEQIDKYEKLRETMSAQEALTAAGITLTKEHAEAFLQASRGI